MSFGAEFPTRDFYDPLWRIVIVILPLVPEVFKERNRIAALIGNPTYTILARYLFWIGNKLFLDQTHPAPHYFLAASIMFNFWVNDPGRPSVVKILVPSIQATFRYGKRRIISHIVIPYPTSNVK